MLFAAAVIAWASSGAAAADMTFCFGELEAVCRAKFGDKFDVTVGCDHGLPISSTSIANK